MPHLLFLALVVEGQENVRESNNSVFFCFLSFFLLCSEIGKKDAAQYSERGKRALGCCMGSNRDRNVSGAS